MIVGIDLGTTNSLIGAMEAGFPVLIADANGERLTPSVVHFPAEGAPFAGRAAARMRTTEPEHTIYSAKRFIGRRVGEENDDVAYRLGGRAGEPVRIVDLAEKMIRLSGKEPGREIAIDFIGPAPGEKLHEVLVGDGETVSASPHPKIDLITRQPVDAEWLETELALLERLVEDGDTLELVGELRRLVGQPRRVHVGTVEPGPVP